MKKGSKILTAINSKRIYNNFKYKLENMKKEEDQNQLNLIFENKYDDALKDLTSNINYLIENILDRDDFIIERSFEYFCLKKYQSNSDYLEIRIYKTEIELLTEIQNKSNVNNYDYKKATIKNSNIYDKYREILDEKFIKYNKKEVESVLNIILKQTKLDRKIKINKMI